MQALEGCGLDPEASGDAAEGLAMSPAQLVEERLIQAWEFLERYPDRERAWLNGGVSSVWRMGVTPKSDRLLERDEARPVQLGLRAEEVDLMEEALRWIDLTRPADRKLIGMALKRLASGQAHVDWGDVRGALGLPISADGVRKRYVRAIAFITSRVSL